MTEAPARIMNDKHAELKGEPEPRPVTYKPGGKSLKALTFKVFLTGKKRPKIITLRAPNGNAFHEKGEQDTLDKFAAALEVQHPFIEFRLVKVARDTYNFVATGELG